MDFYSSIGKPSKIVAPMVEHSGLAYRMLCRQYGAELVYTQMFSAHVFVESKEYRESNFQTCANDRPLIVQFCGNDPKILLEAARLVENDCDAVDVNLGCPQGIARKGHYGAFLMEELELLTEIVSTLSKGLKIPVTCKTRIYKDFDRTIRLCETLTNAGASLLTIHGRTREEKKQLIGAADWSMLQRIKQHFAPTGIPIISNGGIANMGDFHRCLEVTGCDGVMVSEAILEDPAFFSRPSVGDPLPPTQLMLAKEYLAFCKQYPPRHTKTMRSHLMKFLYRYFVVHPEVRTMLGEANSLTEFESICQTLDDLVICDVDYREDWYHRHQRASHAHSGGPSQLSQRFDNKKTCFDFDKTWAAEEEGADGSVEGGIFDGLGMFDS